MVAFQIFLVPRALEALRNVCVLFTIGAILLFSPVASATDIDPGCKKTVYKGASYVVCAFSADTDIRLFLNDSAGEPYRHFNFVIDALAKDNEMLAFAMNAGMYHQDRSPVGLYVENGEELKKANTNEGPGNFHLKPNGVFFKDGEGYHVLDTEQFLKRPESGILDTNVRFATQSGPMLVIDGEIHPRFLPDSESLKRRNGVGIVSFGNVYFVMSDSPVRFHDFAVFFKEELGSRNALYLDGTISRIYAPELERNDPGAAMGPIVGVVVEK